MLTKSRFISGADHEQVACPAVSRSSTNEVVVSVLDSTRSTGTRDGFRAFSSSRFIDCRLDACGLLTCRGDTAGAHCTGFNCGSQGWYAQFIGIELYRQFECRPAVWCAQVEQECRIYGGGSYLAGAGHWR